MSVLLNLGNGALAGKIDYVTGFNPSGLVAMDLDGDGWPDLALVNHGSNTASALLNHADGTFAPKLDFPARVGALAMRAIDADLGARRASPALDARRVRRRAFFSRARRRAFQAAARAIGPAYPREEARV